MAIMKQEIKSDISSTPLSTSLKVNYGTCIFFAIFLIFTFWMGNNPSSTAYDKNMSQLFLIIFIPLTLLILVIGFRVRSAINHSKIVIDDSKIHFVIGKLNGGIETKDIDLANVDMVDGQTKIQMMNMGKSMVNMPLQIIAFYLKDSNKKEIPLAMFNKNILSILMPYIRNNYPNIKIANSLIVNR